MKKYPILFSLVGCLIFATVAIAISYDNPRAVWVWSQNNRHWVYTDWNGFDRYAGDGVLHDFHGSEILNAIGLGIAQRLEQPGRDQNRHIVHLAIQHPGGLLGGKPGWQLS